MTHCNISTLLRVLNENRAGGMHGDGCGRTR